MKPSSSEPKARGPPLPHGLKGQPSLGQANGLVPPDKRSRPEGPVIWAATLSGSGEYGYIPGVSLSSTARLIAAKPPALRTARLRDPGWRLKVRDRRTPGERSRGRSCTTRPYPRTTENNWSSGQMGRNEAHHSGAVSHPASAIIGRSISPHHDRQEVRDPRSRDRAWPFAIQGCALSGRGGGVGEAREASRRPDGRAWSARGDTRSFEFPPLRFRGWNSEFRGHDSAASRA